MDAPQADVPSPISPQDEHAFQPGWGDTSITQVEENQVQERQSEEQNDSIYRGESLSPLRGRFFPRDEKDFLSKSQGTSLTQVAETQEQARQPEEQNDIYRGESLLSPRHRPSSPVTIASSSSSSSGWSGLGLRRGALGAILDRAINRWARARSDTSTTSTTSSTSSTRNRMPRRRTRRSSVATSQNTHNENIIRARRRAWEQGRGVPREFTLFLPTALAPQAVDRRLNHTLQDHRVFRSSSLPLVLSQLDSTIKHSARRKHKQPMITSRGKALGQQNNDNSPSVSTFKPLQSENGKRKIREDIQMHKSADKVGAEKTPRRPAWWLDVASPNWNDMREIGKLLHLHPLTLEDILHQEPREKLEIFPRLGYYFIVFRALESEITRSKARTQLDLTMKGDKTVLPFADGTIGATNVYIVVFREGICTFHFEDISEHTLRVRNRIIKLEETFHMSSDWIAHGILDSIVDQFFPLLNSIEREIKGLDDLVFSINGPLRNRLELGKRALPNKFITRPVKTGEEKLVSVDLASKEKNDTEFSNVDNVPRWSLRCVRPFTWGVSVIRRLVSTSAVSKLKLSPRKEVTPSPSPLMQMASTRRLVISLTRFLGTKSEVVSQIRKRLTGNGLMGSYAIPSEQIQAGEVGIYLGDIQDHILTLQQSLTHYEHMLNHLHPTYLSHLHVSSGKVTSSMDYKLFFLTILIVTIMAMQIPVGVASMNVNLPRNLRITLPPNPPAPFNYFMGVLVIELIVGASVTSMARYWWLRAKRKRQSKISAFEFS